MEPRSIAIAMITVDRSPKENYLTQTIQNMARGGIWFSPFLNRFDLVISTNHFRYVIEALRGHCSQPLVWRPERSYLACENAGRALKIGAESGASWVLFCEDDIDVCSNFLESVAAWLEAYPDERFRIHSFASPYEFSASEKRWICPLTAFYGTQCFAIRAEDAARLSDRLIANPTGHNPNEYDLMIAGWLLENYSPEAILCSVPSFVEHTGIESICNPRPNVHRSPSWPGREWSYV